MNLNIVLLILEDVIQFLEKSTRESGNLARLY